MLIIGDEEIENEVFPVRTHGGGDLGKMKIDTLIDTINQEIEQVIKFNN